MNQQREVVVITGAPGGIRPRYELAKHRGMMLAGLGAAAAGAGVAAMRAGRG